MGLDQSIVKMSCESYLLIEKWQHSDREDDFPEVEMDTVWSGRKENHIQAFIEGEVGNVDNCGYLPLTKPDLERLVDRLARVNADHSQAGVLLPTQEGFFFGGTEYDEWYFMDIKRELEDLSALLQEWDEHSVYCYWAWW